MRFVLSAVLLAAAVFATAALGVDAPAGVTLSLELDSGEVTVGDPIGARLAVTLPTDVTLEPAALGPRLGPFSVVDESWKGPEPRDSGWLWTWEGKLAAFRSGELELPAIRVQLRSADGTTTSAATEPRSLTIVSVLDPAESDPLLGDLKPPADIPADYRALWTASGIVGLLSLAALVAFWLHRRYGARLAAVPPPDDPFQRTPPDVWIYAELQKLLDRRLAEEGRVELFFEEISRLLKTYLGGRYRVELLERTTAEVCLPLRQSAVAEPWIEAIDELLASCDFVKFAQRRPGVEACREAVECTYRIVDATKPAASETAAGAA